MDFTKPPTFSTFDLSLAAALTASGFQISCLEKASYGKSAFIFVRTNGLDDVIQQYWADKLLINARTYFDALKHIKTRLYEVN